MEPASLIIFVVLFALSAFFSWSEIAFMSIPSHTIDTLVKKRKFGARVLKKLKWNTERLLITILIWNNLVNVFTSAYATKISIDFAASSWRTESVAIWTATWIITLMLLLFWEIMPKTFATRYAVPISLYVSQIYYWLQIFLKPVVIAIEWIMKLFQKNKTDHLTTVTPEEIESLVELWRNQWAFDEINYKLIKNMLKFEGISVEETMTPRVKIEAFKSSITVNKAIEKALSFSHSRIPVFSNRIDDIERIVTLRELVNLKAKWHWEDKLKDLMLNKVYKIPLTQPIDAVLEAFKRQRRHIAIVMDEYGWVSWVVTLEDVIEAVFWDFLDETDREIRSIQELEDWYLMQADITIDEMLDEIGLDYLDLDINEQEFGAETLSYFITSTLERFPKKGETIVLTVNKDKWSKDDEDQKKKPDAIEITIKNATTDMIESATIKMIHNN